MVFMASADGFLNILKPPGLTSHDVVDCVRRITCSKAGHTGTLDPAAAGVLVLCVGQATRLARYLEGMRKCYRAEILFGVATDTADAEGVVTSRTPPPAISRDRVEPALEVIQGEVEMVPPAHSAVKVLGKKAYELARQGEDPGLAARRVTVLDTSLVRLDHDPPFRVIIDVECSAGTYIRVLAVMLGEHLGAPAMLAGLLRTAVGPFKLGDAVALEDLAADTWLDAMLPAADGLAHLPSFVLDDEAEQAVRHGNRIEASAQLAGAAAVRLVDSAGDLVAVAEAVGDPPDVHLQPRTVLQ
jgi:tRNA pseudouridine55 synthase